MPKTSFRKNSDSPPLIEPGPISSDFRKNSFALYQKNIDPTHSPHKAIYETMEVRLQKKGPAVPFTLPPDSVAQKVIHAMEAKTPRIRYYVTFPTYLFGYLKRIFYSMP
jgi:hypothetical protein